MIDLNKSMLERNTLTMGIVGTVAIIVVLVLAFNFRSLPVINSGHTMHIEFADASGLHEGDPVLVAGVEVGKVDKISLDGAKVVVDASVDTSDQRLGDDSTAAIKVRTVLGQRCIEITPRGTGSLGKGATIPVARTTSGYDITRSLEEVTGKVSATDTVDLSTALNQLTDVEAALPPDLKSSLSGLSRLSETIASRDSQLRTLLSNSDTTSKVLAQRNQELAALFGQGTTLFTALNRRSEDIHAILVQARQVADGLKGIANDNQTTLKPALDQLNSVLDLLNKNRSNIDQSITGLKTFTYQLGEAVGSGPFFGVLLQNIAPATVPLPATTGAPR
ncbi:Mce family protein [Gordonia polyisoprenivorans NBRC 16320 = JCM 10675]|uniref:MCE family protein n=1 Tax=Gordonia polyisoprenivorans TaxID=84595 RepID=A0A846WHH9_9ACTN|nr:MCE family protein [Gordonia polyisoprenivorans]MBE7194823.1 MCE family protein [Gordonia polyisoprenivorans]NKY00516.1 MCE family protein [Gordonia polyisoprenivorans]OZC29210.1 MCE family protein [Gordonia polyisoprenivorans]GAB24151.1 Mce family protein [Gordonia polyisoprenivorans NBRC 16320 = JCM 10675]